MALPAKNKHSYTYQEYMTFEEGQELRYEYFKGEVFAMAGTTASHNLCVYNITTLMRNHFRPQGCTTFSENVKLEVIAEEFYAYPDVMVTCSERDKENETLKKDPVLIVEVLSEESQGIDIYEKQAYYTNVPSLQVHIVVSQKEYLLHVYERHVNGWSYQVVLGKDQQLHLECFDVVIPVADIYQNVAFRKVNRRENESTGAGGE